MPLREGKREGNIVRVLFADSIDSRGNIPEWRRAVSTEKTATKSWIQQSAGVCGGEPCVRSTRHTVAGLIEWKKQRLTDARILEHHPDLTQADLEVAWGYYARHRDEIDQAIKEAEKA